MVSDKKIHRAFRTHTTLQIKPIREIFIFTMYQNYRPTLALNACRHIVLPCTVCSLCTEMGDAVAMDGNSVGPWSDMNLICPAEWTKEINLSSQILMGSTCAEYCC